MGEHTGSPKTIGVGAGFNPAPTGQTHGSTTTTITLQKAKYSFLFSNLTEKDQVDNLTLPDEIKKDIRDKKLTEKHGRALRKLKDDKDIIYFYRHSM